MRFLEGKKTYISAALVAALVFGHITGLVDDKAYSVLLPLLGAGGVAALRAGINKIY